MEKKDLLKLFKYYKGEEENPYIGSAISKWWDGENALLSLVLHNKGAWQRLLNDLKEAIEEGAVTDHLIDTSISIEQRAIYYYLDLWNGKNFPYDSLDDIFEYVKA